MYCMYSSWPVMRNCSMRRLVRRHRVLALYPRRSSLCSEASRPSICSNEAVIVVGMVLVRFYALGVRRSVFGDAGPAFEQQVAQHARLVLLGLSLFVEAVGDGGITALAGAV